MKKIDFLFPNKPSYGDLLELRPGIFWFPVELPMMGPEFVNCYILEDGEEIDVQKEEMKPKRIIKVRIIRRVEEST